MPLVETLEGIAKAAALADPPSVNQRSSLESKKTFTGFSDEA